MTVGIFWLSTTNLVALKWRRSTLLFVRTHGAEGSSPTAGFYENMYSFFSIMGFNNVILGAWLAHFSSIHALPIMFFGK